MKWWDRLLGRPDDDQDDTDALDDLKSSFKRVRRRTDQLIADYQAAEQRRLELRRP